jgi:hypothetical protein
MQGEWNQKTFENETVRLDGNRYTECVFKNCTLEFAGGPVPEINSCESQDCKWAFTEAAERTLQFMALLYKSGEGGRRLVEYTYEHIMRGQYSGN